MATKSYYGLSSQATSVANANNLTSTGGSASTAQTTGTETFDFAGWMQILSHGGVTNVAGAIGSPNGRGWILDTSELDGTTTPAGVWTALLTLVSSAVAATGDLVVRFYDLDVLGTVYTELGEVTLASQTITTAPGLAATFTTSALAAHAWTANHRLYVDLWWHQTSGGSSTNLISITVASTSQGVAGASGGFELQVPTTVTTVTLGPATSTLRLTGQASIGQVLGPVASVVQLTGATLVQSLLPLPMLPPPKMPIISQGKPSFSSSAFYPAANGTDASYGTLWRTVDVPSAGSPGWFAIDLSTVPTQQRVIVVVNLLNEQGNMYVDPDFSQAASLFRDYTLEGNAAAGGGASPPASGWVVLASVTDNTYPTRQHVLDLTGYTWLRLVVTATAGVAPNSDLSVQIDVHDAHLGAMDRWLFCGDSITLEDLLHPALGGGDWGPAVPGALAQVVHGAPTYGQYYPATIDAGNGGMTIAWADTNQDALLNGFSGGFVSLAFGTNDCIQPGFTFSPGDTNVTTYYAHLLAVIDAALALNNVVIVPYIPWGSDGGFLGTNAQLLNEYVDAHLPSDRPSVLRGPDFWTYFNQHPELIRDGIHPTFTEVDGAASGHEQIHQLWADWMAANIYKISAIAGTVVLNDAPVATLIIGDGPAS